MIKSIIRLILALMILSGCNNTQSITKPTLDYKTEIIGDWVFENEEFVFSFLEDGMVVFSKKLENGLYGNSVTREYTITEDKITTFLSDEIVPLSGGTTMTLTYQPADYFSTILISHALAEYSDREVPRNEVIDDFKLLKTDYSIDQ